MEIMDIKRDCSKKKTTPKPQKTNTPPQKKPHLNQKTSLKPQNQAQTKSASNSVQANACRKHNGADLLELHPSAP